MMTRTNLAVGLCLSVSVAMQTFAAEPVAAFKLRGSASYDHRTEVSTYALKLGTREQYYSVEGLTKPEVGIYSSDHDYESVDVIRRGNGEEEVIPSTGMVRVYPRKRILYDLSIAGIPLKGQYISGAFNYGYFLDGLEVDGESSRGLIDYNSFIGVFRAKRGARFGDSQLSSTVAGSNVLWNRDNYIGQNKITVSMAFGKLKLEGLAYRSDTETVTTDSEGNSTTHVVAYTTRYDVTVTKKDGSALELAPVGEAPTEDDEQIRKLIAMLVLLF